MGGQYTGYRSRFALSACEDEGGGFVQSGQSEHQRGQQCSAHECQATLFQAATELILEDSDGKIDPELEYAYAGENIGFQFEGHGD